MLESSPQYIYQILTLMIILVPPIDAQGIASRYPGDKNIQLDSNVIFTEMGEESNLNELFGRWSANSTSNSIALDTTTFPPGSPGKQSIKLFTTAGQLGNLEHIKPPCCINCYHPASMIHSIYGGMFGTIRQGHSIIPVRVSAAHSRLR